MLYLKNPNSGKKNNVLEKIGFSKALWRKLRNPLREKRLKEKLNKENFVITYTTPL